MGDEADNQVQSGILDFFKDIVMNYEKKPEMNTYKFKWDAANAAGVKGEIWMQYEKDGSNPLHATYTVDLDLNEANLGAIQEAFPDCDYSNIQLTWQLQTSWDNENTSGALDACARDKIGGTFDATYACGSMSQYNGGAACNAQADAGVTYECSPDTYKSKGIACEMGDFSGKYGLVNLGEDLLVQAQGVKDYFAPPESMFSDQWNIGINLVCPSANNPQLVCAKVQMESSGDEGDMTMEAQNTDAAKDAEDCE
jgi:hypothetical protein